MKQTSIWFWTITHHYQNLTQNFDGGWQLCPSNSHISKRNINDAILFFHPHHSKTSIKDMWSYSVCWLFTTVCTIQAHLRIERKELMWTQIMWQHGFLVLWRIDLNRLKIIYKINSSVFYALMSKTHRDMCYHVHCTPYSWIITVSNMKRYTC